jgi:soluble lytic murein transglycosylase
LKRLRNLLVLALIGVLALKSWLYWREHRFDPVIAEAAKRYQIDSDLIRAVIWKESGFNPDAHGRAGELGLMQIRESAASEWAAAERIQAFDHAACLNPLTNVLAGSWYLKKVLQHYDKADDPLAFGLAEYNAGRGNVLKWLDGDSPTNSAAFIQKIGFPGTRSYVRNIIQRYQRHRHVNPS